MSKANKLMLEGLEQLNQVLTGKEVVEFKPTTTKDKTFNVFYSKGNIAYDAMFRLDDDGQMNYHYREVEEDPDLTMISFGANTIDETKRPCKVAEVIEHNLNLFNENSMLLIVARLEEMAIEDYWEWRQELGTDFDECSMRV
jgi:hypothetical protein